jgi:hypothetical protein
VSQVIIQNGFSRNLKTYDVKALELLEIKAIDNKRGIWQKLDPDKIKYIQDSINIRNDNILDSLDQDTLIINNFLIL